MVEHGEDFERLRLPLGLRERHATEEKLVTHQRRHRLTDEQIDVELLGHAFEPRGRVDRVANERHFHFCFAAEVAHDGLAVVHADAEFQIEHAPLRPTGV